LNANLQLATATGECWGETCSLNELKHTDTQWEKPVQSQKIMLRQRPNLCHLLTLDMLFSTYFWSSALRHNVIVDDNLSVNIFTVLNLVFGEWFSWYNVYTNPDITFVGVFYRSKHSQLVSHHYIKGLWKLK